MDRKLFRPRIASEPGVELATGVRHLVERLDGMDRQTDRAPVVGNRASDRLPDPPRRIRRELEAAAELETVHRLHQPDVAFLDQIEQGESASEIPFRDRDDQTEVRLDQLSLRVDEQLFPLAHTLEPLTERAARHSDLCLERMPRVRRITAGFLASNPLELRINP